MANITYGTNNEFGFDYLRDNMATEPDEIVQKKLHFAIVDEVDSVLIDEARTPLIISGPTPKGEEQEFVNLKPVIEKLVTAQRKETTAYLAQAKLLISEGKEADAGMPLLRAHRGLPKQKALIKFLSETGIRTLLQKTESYYMQDQNKEMHKVDEGLYFTIDEKNNTVELTDKGLTLLAGENSDPTFFIMPDVGSEIAKIEKNTFNDNDSKVAAKEKMLADYSIKAERIHTLNQLLKAYTLFELDTEYIVDNNKVKIVDEQTGRVLDGRRYSDGLHQAIEAKENVKVEAATQTFATVTLQNFFRMYHKLAGMTGTAETEAGEFWEIYKLDVVVIPTNKPIVRKDKDDVIYKTSREKYNAVIAEIERYVNNGNPVLVGTTSVEISELLSRMLQMRKIKHNVLNAKKHQSEAQIVAEAGQTGAVTIATNMAGRGTDIKLGAGVKEAGGLAIIGTERHESRRVDRQLRGRSGRQGDPGETQFFISLEDNLMRLFGSERLAKAMDRFGYKEGEALQHSLLTKSLQNAQKKVEENNFGIRKRLLEYDNEMNKQRELIYKKRKHALFGERLKSDLSDLFHDLCEDIVSTYKSIDDYDGFKLEIIKDFGMDTIINKEDFIKKGIQELTSSLFEESFKSYIAKGKRQAELALPVIQNVYRERRDQIENVVVPFQFGEKLMHVPVSLEKAYNSGGTAILDEFEKIVVLSLIDNAWKEHLRDMDDLKQSVQNAVYEQKDPLVIYKFESFELFKRMLQDLRVESIGMLSKASIPVSEPEQVKEARPMPKIRQNLTAVKQDFGQQGGERTQVSEERSEVRREPISVGPKVGRNDPCPCGSGKKYKSCHGINSNEL